MLVSHHTCRFLLVLCAGLISDFIVSHCAAEISFPTPRLVVCIRLIEKYILKSMYYFKILNFFDLHLLSGSSPTLAALTTPLTTSAALESCLRTVRQTDRHKVAGWVSGGGRSRAIIEVLPGLLLLHHHVWSPPRVLEVPLERVGQDLCHLCRSCERKLSHMTVSSEGASV